MKKRKLIILTIAMAAVLALSFALSACSNVLKGPKVEGTQDTSYVVQNNGSGAVRYGNYIYFINGYRGYEDPDADANEWNKVEKGALYRAELVPATPNKPQDSKVQRDFDFYYGTKKLNVFKSKIDSTSHLEFKSTYDPIVGGYLVDEDGEFVLDDDDEKIVDETLNIDNYTVDVQRISSKTIGTSGYDRGGIFIFDGYVFYASPNNNKKGDGVVQTNKTDFYRTSLDGVKTEKIYSTKNDSSSSPYTFYKWQGNYYLVVQDGNDIVSVKIDKKPRSPKTIVKDVSSVYFANKEIYFDGINENTVEDFIYYTRAADDDDRVNMGQVLEMIRPDGSEGILLHNDGGEVSILNCNNGILFYEIASASSTNSKVIIYDNLFDVLMGPEGSEKFSPTYYNAYKNNAPFGQIGGSITSSAVDKFSTKMGLYPNFRNVGEIFIISVAGEGISIYSSASGKTKKLYTGDASFEGIDENILYFSSGGSFMAINLYEGGEVTTFVDDASTAPTFKFSIIGDYVVYYKAYDEWADNYAYFKSLIDPSADAKFVGKIIDADTEPEEEEEEETV